MKINIHLRSGIQIITFYLIVTSFYVWISFKENAAFREVKHPRVASKRSIVDVISIGSDNRLSGQLKTMARHKSIRHFIFSSTDDEMSSCMRKLNRPMVHEIARFCRNSSQPYRRHYASDEFLDDHPIGWVCAQQRPLRLIYRFLIEQASSLPDYLVVLDDDTWYNWDLVIPKLPSPKDSLITVGCLIRSQFEADLIWYWGGLGIILTRASMERLLVPLYCGKQGTAVVGFEAEACRALFKNQVGELELFQPGMSVLQILYEYSIRSPFEQFPNWKHGFCMHSDMALSYFLTQYGIGDVVNNDHQFAAADRLVAFNGTSFHQTRKIPGKVYRSSGACKLQSNIDCHSWSPICHYITADRMDSLFATLFRDSPGNFRSVPSS